MSQEVGKCLVCLDVLGTGDDAVLPCGHQYHTECIHSWSGITNTCPLCKARFREIRRLNVPSSSSSSSSGTASPSSRGNSSSSSRPSFPGTPSAFTRGPSSSRSLSKKPQTFSPIKKQSIGGGDHGAVIFVDEKEQRVDEGFDGGAFEDFACRTCGGSDNPQLLLLCDACDEGYHTYCLNPALDKVPEDDWYCPPCAERRSRGLRPAARYRQQEIPLTQMEEAAGILSPDVSSRRDSRRRQRSAFARSRRGSDASFDADDSFIVPDDDEEDDEDSQFREDELLDDEEDEEDLHDEELVPLVDEEELSPRRSTRRRANTTSYTESPISSPRTRSPRGRNNSSRRGRRRGASRASSRSNGSQSNAQASGFTRSRPAADPGGRGQRGCSRGRGRARGRGRGRGRGGKWMTFFNSLDRTRSRRPATTSSSPVNTRSAASAGSGFQTILPRSPSSNGSSSSSSDKRSKQKNSEEVKPVVPSVRRRRLKRRVNMIDSDSDESDDSGPHTNPKRQRTNGGALTDRSSSSNSHGDLDRFALRAPLSSNSQSSQKASSNPTVNYNSSGKPPQSSSSSSSLNSSRSSGSDTSSSSRLQDTKTSDRKSVLRRFSSSLEESCDDFRSPSKDLVTPSRLVQARLERRAQLSQSFRQESGSVLNSDSSTSLLNGKSEEKSRFFSRSDNVFPKPKNTQSVGACSSSASSSKPSTSSKYSIPDPTASSSRQRVSQISNSRFSPSPSRSRSPSRHSPLRGSVPFSGASPPKRCSPSLSLSPPPSPPMSSRSTSRTDYFGDTRSSSRTDYFGDTLPTISASSSLSVSRQSSSSSVTAIESRYSSSSQTRAHSAIRKNNAAKTGPIDLLSPELSRSNSSSLCGSAEWDKGLKQTSITSHFSCHPSMSQPITRKHKRSRHPLNLARASSSSGLVSRGPDIDFKTSPSLEQLMPHSHPQQSAPPAAATPARMSALSEEQRARIRASRQRANRLKAERVRKKRQLEAMASATPSPAAISVRRAKRPLPFATTGTAAASAPQQPSTSKRLRRSEPSDRSKPVRVPDTPVTDDDDLLRSSSQHRSRFFNSQTSQQVTPTEEVAARKARLRKAMGLTDDGDQFMDKHVKPKVKLSTLDEVPETPEPRFRSALGPTPQNSQSLHASVSNFDSGGNSQAFSKYASSAHSQFSLLDSPCTPSSGAPSFDSKENHFSRVDTNSSPRRSPSQSLRKSSLPRKALDEAHSRMRNGTLFPSPQISPEHDMAFQSRSGRGSGSSLDTNALESRSRSPSLPSLRRALANTTPLHEFYRSR